MNTAVPKPGRKPFSLSAAVIAIAAATIGDERWQCSALVAMADLKAMFEVLEFSDVRTLLTCSTFTA